MELENYDEFPQSLPLIIEDDIFLYPFMIAPIFLNDEQNLKSVQEAIDNNKLVVISVSKPGFEGKRGLDGFYDVGVVGNIMRKITLPDGRVKILFQGLAKGILAEVTKASPASVMTSLLVAEPFDKVKVDATINILKDVVNQYSKVNKQFPADLVSTISQNDDPDRIADLISSVLKISKDDSYKLFSETNLEKRLIYIIEHIKNEMEAIRLQKDVAKEVNSKLEKNNQDYFIKQQIKTLQAQLGDKDSNEQEISKYKKELKSIKKHISQGAYKEISKQINKLSRMHQDSPDASMLQTYIEQVLEIPFGNYSNKKISVQSVEKQLNKDHYSLEKPKMRITEFFAVKQLLEQRKIKDSQNKGTVLCFVGPPGVGKTSLANSIAKALKRSLMRVALGGLDDVNELRGHRRTYVGAMPGRIVQGLITAKTMNPVIVLDEIDKVGRSNRGDPTSVMLEILDPEQNNEFRDLYLNFDIDLSSSIFVATANDLRGIPAPLRDRMEFIQVSSYTPGEKYHIAKDYLLPQERKKHGLKKDEISIDKKTIETIIEKFTREAGVRNLRRVFAKLFRKSVKMLVDDSSKKTITINKKNIEEFLDNPVFEIEPADKKAQIGITNGLAWTAVGGDLLKIEAIKIKGKGLLTLTGKMGDVMKESARISYSVVKVLIDEKKIKIPSKNIVKDAKGMDINVYDSYDIHIHIPDGATPKDGPSAGITMAVTMASILSDTKVRADIAMTGELSLTGKVLPIGGLKEKMIAAYKAGVKTVLVPQKNFKRDLKDIPDEVKSSIEIISVSRIDEVLKLALV
ncbi:MAG: endopeptidase La [Campylobacteraceae bacterium]|nr:endopeptidase La [Campylobacteraceae bacterium]